jgi:CubicO group peptidase (beta-lactamase class C family)
MLTFLAANIGITTTPLGPAMADMLRVSRPGGGPALTIGLGWIVASPPPPNPRIVWHNGGTGGFRSFAGFDPARRIGVVVLSNASTTAGVDDIGVHLLNEKSPLLPPPVKVVRNEVSIDTALFGGYVGKYQLAPGFEITIATRGGRLTAQATGQGAFDLFPEGPRDFFAKVADIQIRFEIDANGKVTAMVLTQSGSPARAPRNP